MNYNGGILSGIQTLLEFFAARCTEKSTLLELMEVLRDRNRWMHTHTLFNL